MTTIDAVRLSEQLQALVDSRLDTIDRMLLGRVPRHDRRAIVDEVEAQIHDQLQAFDPKSLTSDDVLAVLARLDPPEAYLGENAASWARPLSSSGEPVILPRSRPARDWLPVVTAILAGLGLLLIGLALVMVLAALTLENGLLQRALLWSSLGGLVISLGLGVASLGLAITNRHSSPRAMNGGVIGLVAMLLSVIAAVTWMIAF